MSGSRDKTIKLWNTLGECKYTIGEPDGHTEWVSCVRFSPVVNNPLIVSAGWDRQVKVGSRGMVVRTERHALPGLTELMCGNAGSVLEVARHFVADSAVAWCVLCARFWTLVHSTSAEQSWCCRYKL